MVTRAALLPLSGLRAAPDQRDRVREGATSSVAPFLRLPIIALLVAICYYAASEVGFFLKPANTSTATLWPPFAILLAVFLLAPRRIWWVFLLAVLPAHLLVQTGGGTPLLAALAWFVANTGEALIGALCIRYFKREKLLFDSVQGVVIFIVFGCLVAPLAKLALGVLSAPLVPSFLHAGVVSTAQGKAYWMFWMTLLSSNMVAGLTLVPTIVLFGLNGISWIRKVTLVQCVEAGLLAFGIVSVSVLVFGRQITMTNSTPALIYAPLALLLWACLRFGSGGLSVSMSAVGLISIWNAMHGRGLLTGASLEENVLSLHILLGAFALPLMLLAAATAERRLTENSLRNAWSTRIHVQEQESHRIAQELHDDIGQQLALLANEVNQLRMQSDPSATLPLSRLHDRVADISKATRDLSHSLYPPALKYLGLAQALRSLCRNVGATNSMSITFAEENVPTRLAENLSLPLYRIAQEALQNIVKHSHARTAAVELKVQGGRALLRIIDDGLGMSPEQESEGMGLASMRERVTGLHGTFNTSSAPLKGVTIEASVPLNAPPQVGELGANEVA
jgi:signal transduction histidine kinase